MNKTNFNISADELADILADNLADKLSEHTIDICKTFSDSLENVSKEQTDRLYDSLTTVICAELDRYALESGKNNEQ